MGSITSYCVKVINDNFKLLTWLQIFIIAIAPNFIFYQSAQATTVADEGWNVTKKLVQGATTFYDGAKNVVLNGKNYAATGTAAITPVAGQVAKMIVRTGALLAVDLAIKALIGSLDYVMDPANSQVVYNGNANGTYYWDQYPNVTFSTVAEACQYAATHGSYSKWKYYSSLKNGDSYWCYGKELNPQGNEYVPNNDPSIYAIVHGKPGEVDKRTLPYETVASQIISDAVAEKSDAKAYVSSVADTALEDEQNQIVPSTQIIDQLENNKLIPTTETAQGQSTPQSDPKDPTQPKAPPTDIKIDFPVFCSWAPTVCQAAQSGINFVKSYMDDSKALKQEYADNPKFDDKPLEFDKDPSTPDTTISFGGACPAPLNAPYSFMGISGSIEVPFTPFCKIAEVSKPVIIAVSAYFAALIVGGIRSGDA
ncbi:virulence factor TspB C-terminal domain-related protein [Acinetobacter seifertii]|uniref:virulence factor TspB C-terminal domain-related protein n=1 Tax=Acinetobacter seifertii TaxID=1530123 RepID=UPI000C1F6192|nr:virulence factor TspB C-terminal domain-related protein [Acinetobacter seifertii]PJF05137.1 hypothetical protein CVD06_03305 [Acinetobacter seifertii]PJG69293.1 hypothetical protein CVD08_15570 [Acinetobacter seifertii]